MYFQTTVVISFLLTILSMYILLLSRLYFTFRNSIYILSKYIIYTHIINIILILVLSALGYFGLEFSGFLSYLSLAIVAQLMCTIGQIHMLYKFNYCLFSLMVSQRNGSLTNPIENKLCTDPNLDDINAPIVHRKQIHLLSTIRKQTVLAVLMIVILFVIMSVSAVVPMHFPMLDVTHLKYLETVFLFDSSDIQQFHGTAQYNAFSN